MSVDPLAIAAEAGLRYVDPSAPGIIRRRRGTGFSYRGPRGGRIDDVTRRRIDALAIPPAWRDVWIAPRADAHILATGVDEAGRRQYLYHPEFRAAADAVKFARIGVLGERIADLRRAVDRAIAGTDERTRLIGIVVRLIDTTLMRVGSERYAEDNESFGASTLRCEHARVSGTSVSLCFVGKGGKEHRYAVDDRDLLTHLRSRRRAGGAGLLFATADGWTVDGAVVADWLSETARLDLSAKDLRTFGASAAMVRALMEPEPGSDDDARDPVLAAYDAVAVKLGNTRVIARDSYVAPRVVEAHEEGSLAGLWSASRGSALRRREESVLTKLLAE